MLLLLEEKMAPEKILNQIAQRNHMSFKAGYEIDLSGKGVKLELNDLSRTGNRKTHDQYLRGVQV